MPISKYNKKERGGRNSRSFSRSPKRRRTRKEEVGLASVQEESIPMTDMGKTWVSTIYLILVVELFF